ncbi:MAG: cell wall metabolism sensor histidine kinase WalK [Comamonadaceae bacterium]|nr:cell wall metabolism sensor histidine kinase WalK [Comamonadaceae bacterium]
MTAGSGSSSPIRGKASRRLSCLQVFEPFFRVPLQREISLGAGLGLAIVKEIVEAHGGTVGVESREGAGSSFSFTLRRADKFPKEETA